MKQFILSLAGSLLLWGFTATAQKKQQQADQKESGPDIPALQKEFKNIQKDLENKVKEFDEIVIRLKEDLDNKKLVIEIRDGEVMVDGKPLNEFTDEHLAVMKRSLQRFNLVAPPSRFRSPEGQWERSDANPRPFLGVATEGTSGGAKIVNVNPGSAAEKAGLKAGDIITRINDKAVFDHEQVTEIIAALQPGDKVEITYKRNGKEQATTATLGKRPAVTGLSGPQTPRPFEFHFNPDNFPDLMGPNGQLRDFRAGNKPRLGLKVQDTEEGKGVKVLEVEEDSPAAKSGVKANDIITSFDGKPVNSAEELQKASRESKDKTSLSLQLKRNGKTQNLELKIPKKLKTATL